MQYKQSLLRAFLLLAAQTILFVLPAVLAVADIKLLGLGRTDLSFTEIAQEISLFISALLFLIVAKNDVKARGFFILVAGLLAAMLMREIDAVFDLIRKGFWLYPALVVSITAIFFARKYTGTVKAAMLDFMHSKNFVYISLGLLVVMIFSRTFGSGHLWRLVLGQDYVTAYKGVIQEGIELLGYLILLYGSVLVWCESVKERA